jgi:hypothetical protein
MFDAQKTENQITTYMERSLHASLKKHFCPNEDMHEIKMGRFVADACDGKTIFEIQTGNLAPLSKKLNFYLENTDFDIVIVRPIAKNRRIFWLNELGEIEKAPKISPKHESIANGIADLLYVKELVGNERVSFCFPIMEIDEVRLLDGYGKQKKIRATSADRIAGEIYDIKYIRNKNDIRCELFPLLPDKNFTREELSKLLKLKGLKLWSAQKLLIELGLLVSEKDGRRLIFKKANNSFKADNP